MLLLTRAQPQQEGSELLSGQRPRLAVWTCSFLPALNVWFCFAFGSDFRMGAIVTVIFPLLYCYRSVKLAISDAFFYTQPLSCF